jgi:hypothetical protein
MHRLIARPTAARRRSSLFANGLLAGLLAAALSFAAAPALATPITVGGAGGPAFQVDPIYFTAFDSFGLTGPGNGPDYFATSPVTFLSVGNAAGIDLTLSQVLQEPVYQHPQDPSNSQNPLTNGGVPTSPTAALPFVADSIWTLTNTSGQAIEDALLLFTKASGSTGYPAVNVALDDFLYSTLQYESQSAGTLYFGALPLGDLAPGAEVSVRVRYVVADPLLFDGVHDFIMPPFGLSALAKGSYVPEPGTAVLVIAGLAMLRLRARGARA